MIEKTDKREGGFVRKSEGKITTWSRCRRRYTTRVVIYIVREGMARIPPSQFRGQWKAVVKTVIFRYVTTLKHGYPLSETA